ncbi:MAG: O-antigen ligase family protein [Planctomycetota bacterium]
MGFIVVYLLFALSCMLGLIMPPLGVAAFYFFNLLDPVWNWRWDITEDPGFQKWLALTLLAGFVQNRAWTYKFSRFSVYAIGCITTFLLLSYISSFFAVSSEKSNIYLDLLWRIVLVVSISLLVIVDEKRAILLAVACIFGQAYNSFQINLEYLQLGFCRYAYMANWGMKGLDNNTYSILTVPVLALSLAFILSPWKWWIRGIFAGIFCLQVHQIMMMESRGSMLGACLAAVIAVWYCPKKPVTVMVLIVGFLLVSSLAGPPVIREFSTIFSEEEERDVSTESRFYLWKAGAGIIWDYPLLGVGPGNSSLVVPKYYDFKGLQAGTEKALHNLFFEVMCENGVIAGSIYFAYFLVPWAFLFYKRKRFLYENPRQCTLALGVIAGIPGYFLASMFSSGSLIESSYILPIIACALLSIRPASTDHEETDFISDIDRDRDQERRPEFPKVMQRA